MAKIASEKAGLLTATQRTELVGLGERIERTERGMSVMRKLGIGVTELEEKLQWAKKQRQILLDEG